MKNNNNNNKRKLKRKSVKPVETKTEQKFLETKRFVIRKSLIGQGIIFKYINYDGKERNYNHDLPIKKDLIVCILSRNIKTIRKLMIYLSL